MSAAAAAMLPVAALDLVSEAAGVAVDEALRARILAAPRMRARLAAGIAGGRPLAAPPEGAAGRLLAAGSPKALDEACRVAGALAAAGALRRVVDGALVRALRDAAGERGWAAAMAAEAPDDASGDAPCPEPAALPALGREAMFDWLRDRAPEERATLALRLPPQERAALDQPSGGHAAAFEAAAEGLDAPD